MILIIITENKNILLYYTYLLLYKGNNKNIEDLYQLVIIKYNVNKVFKNII